MLWHVSQRNNPPKALQHKQLLMAHDMYVDFERTVSCMPICNVVDVSRMLLLWQKQMRMHCFYFILAQIPLRNMDNRIHRHNCYHPRALLANELFTLLTVCLNQNIISCHACPNDTTSILPNIKDRFAADCSTIIYVKESMIHQCPERSCCRGTIQIMSPTFPINCHLALDFAAPALMR